MYAGSVLHFKEVLESGIRGEDFEIRWRSGNRFRWWGNGFTRREVEGEDLGWYLN